MRSTSIVLTGWTAVAVCLSTNLTMAAPPCGTAEALLCISALTQTPSAGLGNEERKRQAAALLKRARQAMAENNLPAADELISRAEALDVQYGMLHIMGDTPKKARHDLRRKYDVADKPVARPSDPISPMKLFSFGKKKSESMTDPFSASRTDSSSAARATFGRTITTAPPRDHELRRSPASMSGDSHTAPTSAAISILPTQAAAADSDLLLEARLALATGDVSRATELVGQARRRNKSYGLLEDTPEKVEADIANFGRLATQNKDTEIYRREYARVLMQQAEALLAWGDFAEAERLAGQAAGQQVTYGPFDARPRDLLKQITAVRLQESVPADVAAVPSAGTFHSSPPSLAARQKCTKLTRQARAALDAGGLEKAESLARQAQQLRLPETAFSIDEDRPGLVLLDIRYARINGGPQVVPTGGRFGNAVADSGVAPRAFYDQLRDPTGNVPAVSVQSGQPYGAGMAAPRQFNLAQNTPPPAPIAESIPALPDVSTADTGTALFQQGVAALEAGDPQRAHEYFRQAARYTSQMNPEISQRLQEHLRVLSSPGTRGAPAGPSPSMVDETTAAQRMLISEISNEIAHAERNARSMRDSDSNGALALLQNTRARVEQAGLESAARGTLLRRVDRSIREMQQFIHDNQGLIELRDRNQRTRAEIEREKRFELEKQDKLASLVNQYNELVDQQRFAEAEVIAGQASELAPTNPLIQQLRWNSRFIRRFYNNLAVRDAQEQGFIRALGNVDESAIPFDDNNPYVFPGPVEWKQLTDIRGGLMIDERRRNRTEQEWVIEQKLKTPVSLRFKNAPLGQVLDYLAELTGVNMFLDARGLAEEGVSSDTPVTIELSNEIMLKSALNLILQPHHLSYVIKDEVLKITSEHQRKGEVYTVSYTVADLIIPIPNFVPTARMGLAGALENALGQMGFGSGAPGGWGGSTMPVLADAGGAGANPNVNPNVLAQMVGGPASGVSGGGTPGGGMPIGFGPGGLGGGSQADFDQLMELIQSTVRPDSWTDVGGEGSIASFETNLSLVVSQTQEVHEEIVELLEQLRRMQDLQVTIEVRFITLNDNFFERIGVDFDFDVNDNIDRPFQVFGRADRTASTTYSPGPFIANIGPPRDVQDVDHDRSVTVGMDLPGIFSADLDIPFRQGSYDLAVPTFGGFNASAGASLGFAILSDIEAFFFINAAQGDTRSNVLQAPKVTLFNGQQAFVSDTSQSPFVISVIPVVGDFAASQQPVIVVLSEGTYMTVQAVVSADRRYVRLTVVPFFSKIGAVNTFTFNSSETSTTDTNSGAFVDNTPDSDDTRIDNSTDNTIITRSGTTVQLPTFSFITVTTTVSVPDGGTVLLGGIKRLSEGRNEFGVPMLNKIPYINRLFKNVGIGRETQTLMMMVTPRIIIQEEEEQKLGT